MLIVHIRFNICEKVRKLFELHEAKWNPLISELTEEDMLNVYNVVTSKWDLGSDVSICKCDDPIAMAACVLMNVLLPFRRPMEDLTDLFFSSDSAFHMLSYYYAARIMSTKMMEINQIEMGYPPSSTFAEFSTMSMSILSDYYKMLSSSILRTIC